MVLLIGELEESYGYCCAVIAIVPALVLLKVLSMLESSCMFSRDLMVVQENLYSCVGRCLALASVGPSALWRNDVATIHCIFHIGVMRLTASMHLANIQRSITARQTYCYSLVRMGILGSST